MDFNAAFGSAAVVGETKFSKLVHEKTHVGSCCSIISARVSWLILAMIGPGFPRRIQTRIWSVILAV